MRSPWCPDTSQASPLCRIMVVHFKWIRLHFWNVIHTFCVVDAEIPCRASSKNWTIFLHDVHSLISGRLHGDVGPFENDDGSMGEYVKPGHVVISLQQLFPHVDVALSLSFPFLHVSPAEVPQVLVIVDPVETICGNESYSALVVVTHCWVSSLAVLVVTICPVKSVALLVFTICPVDSRVLLVFTICLGDSMTFTWPYAIFSKELSW